MGAGRNTGRLWGPTSAARTAAEVVFLASQGRERFQERLDWQFADATEVAALGPLNRSNLIWIAVTHDVLFARCQSFFFFFLTQNCVLQKRSSGAELTESMAPRCGHQLPERPRCTAPAGCRSWTPQGSETSSLCCSGGEKNKNKSKNTFHPPWLGHSVKYGSKPSTPRFPV